MIKTLTLMLDSYPTALERGKHLKVTVYTGENSADFTGHIAELEELVFELEKDVWVREMLFSTQIH